LSENTIKVDEETHHLVSELAYLMGCTKKSVVREAVVELAHARRSALIRAPSRAGDVPGSAGPTAEAVHDIGTAHPVEVLPSGGSGAAGRETSGPTGAEVHAAGSVTAAAVAATPRFDELSLHERVALRRSELIREFARQGASNVRLVEPVGERADGEEIALVADTDVLDGSSAVLKLQTAARRIIRARVHVTSTTELRLFDPEGLARALAASRPL
jgi:hypothetical protein